MRKRKIQALILGTLLCTGVACNQGVEAGNYTQTPIPATVDNTSEDSWIVPNKYIVDFEDDTDRSEIKRDMGSLTYTDGPNWDEMKMEIVTTTHKSDLERLYGDEDVEGIEPLVIMRTSGIFASSPNDPLYEKQWHMKNVGAETAWGYSSGRGVTVAVIDTGVACDNYSHFHKVSDLEGTNCVAGYNFVDNNDHPNDDHGHGTHVAGTIAQTIHNGIGGVGLAFGVNIMPVKVLSAHGGGTSAGVAAGIKWAADNGAEVINMSLGSPVASGVISRAVKYAHNNGVVVVAAAGNDGGPVGYPGACDGVIGVSATDSSDNIARFSSRGKQIDLGAPGVDVTQNTICDEGRNNCEDFPAWSGTSMASPHVAGAAALLVGQGINDPDTVEQILKETSLEKGSPNEYGAGILRADDAVASVHWKQAGLRGLLLFFLSFLTFKMASSKGNTYSSRSPSYWLAGITVGVGALFFAPLFFSRHTFLVDLFSHPMSEWSLLYDVGIHKYLPLANVGVPLIAAAAFLKAHAGAGKWLAGLFVGTSAYLCSVVFLGQLVTPFGWALTTAWCLGNAAVCLYIGSLLLVKPNPAASNTSTASV